MPLDSARWERIQGLFHQAAELAEPERLMFLESACGGDADLLAEVLALLAEDAREISPLERGPAEIMRAVFDGSVPLLRFVGPHRIVRVLGQGGMGVVYLAEREDLQSRVAIKVLRDASLSPARRERFFREQQTLAQLNHPSIARLYDAAILPDGTPYFVMEYVEGVPLTEYCRTHGCSVAERLRLFRSVCEAVQHAHGRAVIHRDLKPSNILVTDDGEVKLLDFGIAKQLESLGGAVEVTEVGLRLMTPTYAAPEQIRGEQVGTYTDVYALGLLLYELLTEQRPFDLTGCTPGAMEALIVTNEPERPSERVERATLPGRRTVERRQWKDLDVLCLTAMHKDAQRRYATVEALLRDVDHYLRDQPLEARPDGWGYRAGKFLRRNRQPVGAGVLAAALFAGSLGLHTVRLAEQRNRAETAAEKADQVSEYLIGLFEAGDPYSPEADNLDVRTLLERGERRAEELTGQPAVQATMLDVLGRVYSQLSDFGRAEPLLVRALDLRRLHGDPLDLAESLFSLASLYVDTGDYGGAETALREALTLRERHLPPNHPDIAANLASLGSVLNYKGRYADAEALHGLALRMRRTIHPRPHEDLGASLNGLAVALFQQGKYASAEHAYREALAVKREVFGPEHASVTRVLANLGKLYEELGDYAAADSLLSEALRVRRATLGDDHFETAIGLGQLAGLYTVMGQHERAEAYLRESLAIRERILAPDHPSIGTMLNNLASTLEQRGEYEEAGAFFRRAVEVYREGLGERHRFTGVALCNLGHALYLTGQVDGAVTHLRDCLSILEEVHPDDHQELAHNRSRFGAVLVAQGRYDEAEPLMRGAHQTLEAQLGAEHARTRHAAQRLAELYEARGRPEREGSDRQALGGAVGEG